MGPNNGGIEVVVLRRLQHTIPSVNGRHGMKPKLNRGRYIKEPIILMLDLI
jgi:hypothetical protein